MTTQIEFTKHEIIVRSPIAVNALLALQEFAESVLDGTGSIVANSQKANAINASLYLERKN